MLRRFSIRRRRPSVKTFNVITLDGSTLSFNLDSRSNGKELLDKVLQDCAITSVDRLHFSLAVQEDKYLKWILLQKPLKKQLSGSSPYTLLFRVHIYPYNHHSLMQSLTRHYLYLQIKQDLRQNRLQPSSPTALTHIASLVVQGEIGNYIPHTCTNGYIEDLQILPNMTSGMEEAIRQAHRLNRGRLPGECEEEVLDLAQEEPTYGSLYYTIQDSHRQPVTMCVCPVGIRVAQGGRQINCFKWESITKVTSRSKHIYLYLDASQTLAAYQMHYSCTSSQMAVAIAAWCQILINFYCSVAQEEVSTKSRLRRFFSTRRSLRRGSQVRRQTTYVYPGSNPVQRRSRRASVPGDVHIINNKTNARSPSQSKKEKKQESKLVIYGLSGLASQPDEESEEPLPTKISLASPSHEPSQVPPSTAAPEDRASDVFTEEDEDLETVVERQPQMDTMLHVIQEEKSGQISHVGSSSSLARREREDHGLGVHLGSGSPSRRDDRKMHGGSSNSSLSRRGVGSETSPKHMVHQSSPRQEKRRDDHVVRGLGSDSSPRQEKRRDEHMGHQRGIGSDSLPSQDKRRDMLEGGSYGGGAGERRGDQQWFVPNHQSSASSDLEHKSVSTLIQQRHIVPGLSDDPHTPPPLPPRKYSETEMLMEGGGTGRRGYDKEHEKSSYVPRQQYHRNQNGRSSQSGRDYRDKSGRGSGMEYSHSSRGSQSGLDYGRSSSRGLQSGMEYDRGSRGALNGMEYGHSDGRGSQTGTEYSHSGRVSQAGTEYSHSSRGSQSEYGGEETNAWYQNGTSSLSNNNRRGSNSARDFNGRASPPHHNQNGGQAHSPRQQRSLTLTHTSSGGGLSPSHRYPHRERPSSARTPSSSLPPNSHPPHHQRSNFQRGHFTYRSSPHRSSPRHRPATHSSMGELGRYHHYQSSQPQSRADDRSPNPTSPDYFSQPSSANHSLRRSYRSGKVEDAQSKSNYWQESSGRSSAGDDQISLDSSTYQDEVTLNGTRSDYNRQPKGNAHFPSAHHHHEVRRREPSRSSLHSYRRHSQGESLSGDSMKWEHGGGSRGIGGSAGPGDRKHHHSHHHHPHSHNQAWKGGRYNGVWHEDEDAQQPPRTSNSLPLRTDPSYSLYEEDEELMGEEGKRGRVSAARPRASMPDAHEGGRHVSRQHRLRHSTITSLTSLCSDITTGMSRLGSIASLDYQASFAELSQADSVSGYIDPHVRSLVFEASQNSQGTEL